MHPQQNMFSLNMFGLNFLESLHQEFDIMKNHSFTFFFLLLRRWFFLLITLNLSALMQVKKKLGGKEKRRFTRWVWNEGTDDLRHSTWSIQGFKLGKSRGERIQVQESDDDTETKMWSRFNKQQNANQYLTFHCIRVERKTNRYFALIIHTFQDN